MTATQIVDEVVDAELLTEITGDVFAGMFGEGWERPSPAYTSGAHEVRSSVEISGGWTGSVSFSCSLALARWAAVELLGLTEGAVTSADVADLVGEIVNVVGGNVKSLLPGPSVLSLPRTMLTNAVAAPGAALSVDLQWCGHAVRVDVAPGGADHP